MRTVILKNLVKQTANTDFRIIAKHCPVYKFRKLTIFILNSYAMKTLDTLNDLVEKKKYTNLSFKYHIQNSLMTP